MDRTCANHPIRVERLGPTPIACALPIHDLRVCEICVNERHQISHVHGILFRQVSEEFFFTEDEVYFTQTIILRRRQNL
jgi:hypothetical protein